MSPTPRLASRPVSTAVQHRLDELAAAYALRPGSTEALGVILDLLASEPASVTSVRDPLKAADAHVADSLTGLGLDVVQRARRVADIGSGSGFPGLALAAALPDAHVTLVESVSRKCAFLERAVRAAELGNVVVACTRAEEWRDGLGAHDLVTARALAPLAVVAEYAAPLLSEGGAMVAWKGRRTQQEEADGAAAAAALGLEPVAPVAVAPYAGAGERHLYVYLKVRETPSAYPRRAGIARKRPLRA